MYQWLSLKTNKEYLCDPLNFGIGTFDEITDDMWDEKPLFSTMLNYLNTDFDAEARKRFIYDMAFFAGYSKIKGEHDAKRDLEYDWKDTDYRIKKLQHLNHMLINDIFCYFPKERSRKSALTRKKRAKSGMTINIEYEKIAIQMYRRALLSNKKRQIDKINILKNYIDYMNKNPNLREPYIFELYIASLMEDGRYFYIDAKPIRPALPYCHKEYGLSKSSPSDLLESLNRTYKKKYYKYDDYIIDTLEPEYQKEVFIIAASNIYFILQRGKIVAKCANCGKYFVPLTKTDVKYCQNPSPMDITKTCQEYVKSYVYYNNMKNDETEKLRSQIKSRLSKRAQRKKAYGYSNDERKYDIFREQDKEYRLSITKGNKSQIEYLEWLVKIEKDTRNNK